VSWRFRRSFRIARGVHLNASRSGLSLTVGGRGMHATFGPRGTRTGVGLPGTGWSWQSSSHQPRPCTLCRPPDVEQPHGHGCALVLLAALAALAAVAWWWLWLASRTRG
jgi:hypothetical protein